MDGIESQINNETAEAQINRWVDSYSGPSNLPLEAIGSKEFWLALKTRLNSAYLCRDFNSIPKNLFNADERREFWLSVDAFDFARFYHNIPEGLFSEQEIIERWMKAYKEDPNFVGDIFDKVPKIVLDFMENKGFLSLSKKELNRSDGLKIEIEEFSDANTRHPFGTKDIVAADHQGNVIRFSTLASPSFKFVSMAQNQECFWDAINQNTVWSCDSRRKIILYGDLAERGSLFTLLHEAGHSFQEDLASKIEEGEYNLKLAEKGNKGGEVDRLIQEHIGLLAKAERDAWAYALSQIRLLRRNQNFDLEPSLKTKNDFDRIIGTCLCVYDQGKSIEMGIETMAFSRNQFRLDDDLLAFFNEEQEKFEKENAA